MRNVSKKLLIAMTLIFICNSAFGQSNEIKIKFIGNCGLYMTDGTTNIYTDFPYVSGAHNYMKYDKSELSTIKDNAVFIFTHHHTDHYDKKIVKKLKRENGAQVYDSGNKGKLEQLNSLTNGFSIQPFKTKHKFTLKHYSYLITWHNKKIFLSGDTEDAKTISTVKNIDWAFVPSWLLSDAKTLRAKT